jgi:hypothetical protein
VREGLKSQKGIDYIAKMTYLFEKVLIFLAHETVRFGTDCTATPGPNPKRSKRWVSQMSVALCG